MKKICVIAAITILAGATALLTPNTGNAQAANSSPRQTAGEAKTGINSGKVLVTYFTWPEPDGVDASSGASRTISDGKLYGNTEYVALIIANATNGRLFAIETSKKYPAPHRALIEDAKKEAEANARPELTTHIENLEDYDIVFVGYPNWWYDMPMVIYSFFDEYDFSGKTVIPFVTHGGSRFSQSVETIAAIEKNARVIEGPSVSSRNVSESRTIIENWLQKQGFSKE